MKSKVRVWEYEFKFYLNLYRNVVVLKADSTLYPQGGHQRRENAVYILLYFLIVFVF